MSNPTALEVEVVFWFSFGCEKMTLIHPQMESQNFQTRQLIARSDKQMIARMNHNFSHELEPFEPPWELSINRKHWAMILE